MSGTDWFFVSALTVIGALFLTVGAALWITRGQAEIECAPWCRPRARAAGPGVTVTTLYGFHMLAACIHVVWRKAVPGER